MHNAKTIEQILGIDNITDPVTVIVRQFYEGNPMFEELSIEILRKKSESSDVVCPWSNEELEKWLCVNRGFKLLRFEEPDKNRYWHMVFENPYYGKYCRNGLKTTLPATQSVADETDPFPKDFTRENLLLSGQQKFLKSQENIMNFSKKFLKKKVEGASRIPYPVKSWNELAVRAETEEIEKTGWKVRFTERLGETMGLFFE